MKILLSVLYCLYVFIFALFTSVPADKLYTVAAAMVVCYGFGTLKK